jgi:threonine/homoserine/homoserine lactone efflux protein
MFLLKGIILGFAIAAPVGPIGLLCIRRTLCFGRWSGIFTGLGAAVADTFYGCVAAFGLSLVSDFFLTHQFWLRLVGGIFLLFIGARTFLSKTDHMSGTITHYTLLKDFVSTFFLTLTNPMTILSYAAIFAGLGLGNIKGDYKEAAFLVLGVFIGSTLWWLILSEGITLFRKNLNTTVSLWINRLAGILIMCFGIFAFLSIIFKWFK